MPIYCIASSFILFHFLSKKKSNRTINHYNQIERCGRKWRWISSMSGREGRGIKSKHSFSLKMMYFIYFNIYSFFHSNRIFLVTLVVLDTLLMKNVKFPAYKFSPKFCLSFHSPSEPPPVRHHVCIFVDSFCNDIFMFLMLMLLTDATVCYWFSSNCCLLMMLDVLKPKIKKW